MMLVIQMNMMMPNKKIIQNNIKILVIKIPMNIINNLIIRKNFYKILIKSMKNMNIIYNNMRYNAKDNYNRKKIF